MVFTRSEDRVRVESAICAAVDRSVRAVRIDPSNHVAEVLRRFLGPKPWMTPALSTSVFV
jgi:hypothetical protein